MKYLISFFILATLFVIENRAYGQTQTRKDYALIFAVQDYDSLPKLERPIADAELLKEVLQNYYGFEEPEIIPNPTASIFQSKMEDYSKKTFGSSDQVLVLFIGHANVDGRIAFKGASRTTIHEGYVNKDDLESYIDNIKCNHILFINDACYSGQKTKGTPKVNTQQSLNDYLTQYLSANGKSRLCISATARNKQILDGVFMKYFIEILKNNQSYVLLADEISNQLNKKQKSEEGLFPEFRTLKGNDLKNNNFLFIRKKKPYSLIFSGSSTIGKQLAPDLLKAFYESKGYKSWERKINDKEKEFIFYNNKDADSAKVLLRVLGTEEGFKDGMADIIMASRKKTIKDSLSTIYIDDEKLIGFDAVAIIVNESNNIRTLSTNEVANILTGEAKTWKNSGKKINVYTTDNNSGTLTYMKNVLLGKKSMSSTVRQFGNTEEVVSKVMADSNGIGFVSFTTEGLVNTNVMAIKGDKQVQGYLPNYRTILQDNYPLIRKIFFYKHKETTKNSIVKEFFAFIDSSKKAREVIKECRFVPTLGEIISDSQLILDKDTLNERFSITIQFDPKTLDIQENSYRNIDYIGNLLALSREYSNAKVYIVGYSDDTPVKGMNPFNVSTERAKLVSYRIESHGVHAEKIEGLGEQYPVKNPSKDIKAKNCKVEIWIKREKRK
jgi:phosphate transport system substrate-binding protein